MAALDTDIKNNNPDFQKLNLPKQKYFDSSSGSK